MTFWGICLRAELEADPNYWPIARDFASEQSALSATSVPTRVKRTESKQDYSGVALTPWRDYWIDGNGKEPGKVYRFEPNGVALSAVPPSAASRAKPAKKTKKTVGKRTRREKGRK